MSAAPSDKSSSETPTDDDLSLGAADIKVVQAQGVPAVVYHLQRGRIGIWVVLPTGAATFTFLRASTDSLVADVSAVYCGVRAPGADSAGAKPVVSTEQHERGVVPAKGQCGAWHDAASRLCRTLFPPSVRRQLPSSGELLIIPDNLLFALPFDALLDSSGTPLATRYAVRIAPSLQALAAIAPSRTDATDRTKLLDHMIVVGNPTMPHVRDSLDRLVSLAALPGAEREAIWLRDNLHVRALIGRDATKRTVVSLLPSASIVHLATHGMVHTTRSRVSESWVALADDGPSDGLLTVGDIASRLPPLTAELITLSACQTGSGSLTLSEGILGFQRILLGRGARSVLVSQWSVDDRATELLMESFYRHWLRDPGAPSKAEALRLAQADVRAADPRYSHPFYWAAFQIVGAR